MSSDAFNCRFASVLLVFLWGCGAPSARATTAASSERSTEAVDEVVVARDPGPVTPAPAPSSSSEQRSTPASSPTPSQAPAPLEQPPVPVAASAPAPVRAAIVTEDGFVTVGLPAMSPDGRAIVWLESGGDGLDGRDALVTLDARTGRLERRDPLRESRASEEGEAAEARRRQAGRQIARAQRYLARRSFFSLRRLEELAEGDEALTLEVHEGTVEILDAASRSRFRRELVAPAPEQPPDLDDDALDAWEVEHRCDDYLQDVSAWRIDATHLLLIVRIGATPDECWEQDQALVVTLSP